MKVETRLAVLAAVAAGAVAVGAAPVVHSAETHLQTARGWGDSWGTPQDGSTTVDCSLETGDGIGNGCFNGGNSVTNAGSTTSSDTAGGTESKDETIDCDTGTGIGIGNGCFNGGNSVGNVGTTQSSDSAKRGLLVRDEVLSDGSLNNVYGGAFNGQGNGGNHADALNDNNVDVSA